MVSSQGSVRTLSMPLSMAGPGESVLLHLDCDALALHGVRCGRSCQAEVRPEQSQLDVGGGPDSSCWLHGVYLPACTGPNPTVSSTLIGLSISISLLDLFCLPNLETAVCRPPGAGSAHGSRPSASTPHLCSNSRKHWPQTGKDYPRT